MGRANERETSLVRVVRDASGAAILLVAGAAPLIYRVLGLKPKKVTEFDMEPVEGEFYRAGDGTDGLLALSPLFPADMLIYPGTWAIADDNLLPVDVLWIASGSSYYGTARQGYYFWQVGTLEPLTLMEARGALASPWVRSLRSQRQQGRGIILRS